MTITLSCDDLSSFRAAPPHQLRRGTSTISGRMTGRFLLLLFAHLVCICATFAHGGYISMHNSQHAQLASQHRSLVQVAERAGTHSCVQGTTRRSFCVTSSVAAVLSLLLQPAAAQAKATFTMDENGEYVAVEEKEWTEVWKDRASKMQSMSADEIFMAGRGAGKADVSELSDAGKKRRALAGCRDSASRQQIKKLSEKECTTRVLQGELSFILDVM